MPAGGPKRLNWEWEELVLACDLLMQNHGRSVDHEDPRASELSAVLRKMKLHPQEDRLPDFRNPNGVAQKTRN
jgi:5-methylcytosine-specific restriction enzyme A